jgi:predicted ABC-type ATPase
MRSGKNVIWDTTMTSAGSTLRRIADLRQAGYRQVEAIFVDIPVEVSIRRADARHREGHNAFRAGLGLGGRLVPAELIRQRADREKGSQPRRTFEQVQPLLDAWRLFDNSADGRAPVLIDAGKREEE